MNEFRKALLADFGAALSENFQKRASYYTTIDCIEYLSADVITISDRVDSFLTVLWNEDFSDFVGFRLKGFHAWYVNFDKKGGNFNLLVEALEHYCTQLGDEIFPEESPRKATYLKLINFIKEEDIALAANDMDELQAAA